MHQFLKTVIRLVKSGNTKVSLSLPPGSMPLSSVSDGDAKNASGLKTLSSCSLLQ
jgi:hypothetical protein